MTTIRNDDPRDLLPSEYQDPWPPSDAEIEMMEWLQDQEDLEKTVPSAAERNRRDIGGRLWNLGTLRVQLLSRI